MPEFVPIQKHRNPGSKEKTCPPCMGTGSVDAHVCNVCHGSGAVPKDWKQGDGPVSQEDMVGAMDPPEPDADDKGQPTKGVG